MDGNMDGRIDADAGGTRPMQGAEPEGTIDRAKDSARAAIADVRDAAAERVESRKNRAADTLSSVARSLRSSTDQLRDDDYGAGQYIRQAADQVDRLAGYLQGRDANEMLDQAEDFARRQPALFIGTAFAMGLLGARFLKSSRERLDRERYGYSSPGGDFDRPMTGDAGDPYSRTSDSTRPDGMDETSDYGTVRAPLTDYGSAGARRQMGYAASPERSGGMRDRNDDLDPGMR